MLNSPIDRQCVENFKSFSLLYCTGRHSIPQWKDIRDPDMGQIQEKPRLD